MSNLTAAGPSATEAGYEEKLEMARARRKQLRRRLIDTMKELEKVNGFIGWTTAKAKLEAERDASD